MALFFPPGRCCILIYSDVSSIQNFIYKDLGLKSRGLRDGINPRPEGRGNSGERDLKIVAIQAVAIQWWMKLTDMNKAAMILFMAAL